jgi:hypothetical protein
MNEPQEDIDIQKNNDYYSINDKNYPNPNVYNFDEGYPAFVTAYFINREYGGPEEGGWWYNSSTLIESVQVSTPEEAYKKVIELFEKYREEYNDDKYELSSVMSQGKLSVLTEKIKGENQNTEKPVYE